MILFGKMYICASCKSLFIQQHTETVCELCLKTHSKLDMCLNSGCFQETPMSPIDFCLSCQDLENRREPVRVFMEDRLWSETNLFSVGCRNLLYQLTTFPKDICFMIGDMSFVWNILKLLKNMESFLLCQTKRHLIF